LDQIFYSTLFGGSAFDGVYALGIDSTGAVVLTGYTLSEDFPTAGNAAQTSNGGGSDLFITRFDIAANGPVYSTYLGGSGSDVPYAFALDREGRAWVAGYSSSPNLPVRGDALQSALGGAWDAFFARVDVQSAGDSLAYLSYVGGPMPDVAYGLAVDANGVLYVAGSTSNSSGFPISEGAFAGAYSGYSDGFVMKMTIGQ
jgi:hypothetical protein